MTKAKQAEAKQNARAMRNPLPWSAKQVQYAEQLANKHGMSVDELFAIIDRETGGTFNPATGNGIGATGLIQFTGSTGADLLLAQRRNEALANAKTPEERVQAARQNKLWWQLTPAEQAQASGWAREKLRKMTVYDQLDLADQLLQQKMKGSKGFDNAYSAVFTGKKDTQALKQGTAAYENNKSVDVNKDGKISRDEWLNKARQRVGARPDVLDLPDTPEITPEWAWAQHAFDEPEVAEDGFRMPKPEKLGQFPKSAEEILQSMQRPELDEEDEA